MVYKYKPKTRYSSKYNNKKRYGLATKPQMMSVALRRKRKWAIDTKVFFLKFNIIEYFTNEETINYGIRPLYQVRQFKTICTLYESYKVLAMNFQMFPANVNVNDPSPNSLFRGNSILLTTQDLTAGTPAIVGIEEVINSGSCKIIDQLKKQWRNIYRPTGEDKWFDTQEDVATGLPKEVDTWNPAIRHFTQNSATQPSIAKWYVLLTYKVIFRQRKDDGT